MQTAHSRVYASNESRGSVAGWAPSAALRPATDAEIATRVSGVSTAYVANARLHRCLLRRPHRRLMTIWTTDRRSTPTVSRTSNSPLAESLLPKHCPMSSGRWRVLPRPRASIVSWRPPSSSTAFARAAPSVAPRPLCRSLRHRRLRHCREYGQGRRACSNAKASPLATVCSDRRPPPPPPPRQCRRRWRAWRAATRRAPLARRRHSSDQPDTRDQAYIRNRICERSSTARRPNSTGSCS
jgi:hypothetical protein